MTVDSDCGFWCNFSVRAYLVPSQSVSIVPSAEQNVQQGFSYWEYHCARKQQPRRENYIVLPGNSFQS